MDYQRIYNQLIEKAQNRTLEGYTEKHHILPKCLGGNNDKENLVELTAREHFLCHMLLCEIYPKENKLKHALFLMSIGKQKIKKNHYVIGSRVYERLKIEYSQFLTGKKHSIETCLKKSKASLGKPKSEEHKANIGKGRTGITHKTHPKGEEHGNFGRVLSEEHIEIIRLTHIGLKTHITPHSEETNLKISQSKRKWKHIEQLDLNYNLIQIFNTQAEAEKKFKGVSNVLCGIAKTAGGYYWRHVY
jgi:hypothetical protein